MENLHNSDGQDIDDVQATLAGVSHAVTSSSSHTVESGDFKERSDQSDSALEKPDRSDVTLEQGSVDKREEQLKLKLRTEARLQQLKLRPILINREVNRTKYFMMESLHEDVKELKVNIVTGIQYGAELQSQLTSCCMLQDSVKSEMRQMIPALIDQAKDMGLTVKVTEDRESIRKCTMEPKQEHNAANSHTQNKSHATQPAVPGTSQTNVDDKLTSCTRKSHQSVVETQLGERADDNTSSFKQTHFDQDAVSAISKQEDNSDNGFVVVETTDLHQTYVDSLASLTSQQVATGSASKEIAVYPQQNDNAMQVTQSHQQPNQQVIINDVETAPANQQPNEEAISNDAQTIPGYQEPNEQVINKDVQTTHGYQEPNQQGINKDVQTIPGSQQPNQQSTQVCRQLTAGAIQTASIHQQDVGPNPEEQVADYCNEVPPGCQQPGNYDYSSGATNSALQKTSHDELVRHATHSEKMDDTSISSKQAARCEQGINGSSDLRPTQGAVVNLPENNKIVPYVNSNINKTCEERTNQLTSSRDTQKEVKDNEINSIDLILIGNSGNGKSATGNSILKKPAFKRSASSSVASGSLSTNVMKENTIIGDKIVNVIDGPSIDDCGKIAPEDLEKIIQAMEKSLELCNYGFAAILIVLKFGQRFTKQEMEAVKVIKSVLGPDVIKDYGVCVLTHGDNFDDAVEEAAEDGDNMTFESWLKAQTGEITSLFEECAYRCVLFDNLTKDNDKKDKQIQMLMSVLPRGAKYSKEKFCQAGESQQELKLESSLPGILKQMRMEVDDMRHEMHKIEENREDDADYKVKMESLITELQKMKEDINKIHVRSPDVDGVKLLFKTFETEIKLKIDHFVVRDQMRTAGKRNGAFHTKDEVRESIVQLRHDLEHCEKISDAQIKTSVMEMLREKLQKFTKEIEKGDIHLRSDKVMKEISKLQTRIQEVHKRCSLSYKSGPDGGSNTPTRDETHTKRASGNVMVVNNAQHTELSLWGSRRVTQGASSQPDGYSTTDIIRRRMIGWPSSK